MTSVIGDRKLPGMLPGLYITGSGRGWQRPPVQALGRVHGFNLHSRCGVDETVTAILHAAGPNGGGMHAGG